MNRTLQVGWTPILHLSPHLTRPLYSPRSGPRFSATPTQLWASSLNSQHWEGGPNWSTNFCCSGLDATLCTAPFCHLKENLSEDKSDIRWQSRKMETTWIPHELGWLPITEKSTTSGWSPVWMMTFLYFLIAQSCVSPDSSWEHPKWCVAFA